MSDGTFVLLLILAGASLLILAVYLDLKSDRKKREDFLVNLTKKKDDWVKEHETKPLYKVVVKTKTNIQFESPVFNHYAEIKSIFYDCEQLEAKSSYEQAQALIERSIKNNSFLDKKTDTYVPMCEVEYLQAVKV